MVDAKLQYKAPQMVAAAEKKLQLEDPLTEAAVTGHEGAQWLIQAKQDRQKQLILSDEDTHVVPSLQ